jgi:membrane fusion protein (multidrug efflux system)
MKDSAKKILGRGVRGTGLMGIALLAACGRGTEPADAREPSAVTLGAENVLVVGTGELRSGPLVSGTLAAEREAAVRAELSGPVLQVMADQGQAVRQGQVLARIDDTALQDALLSARSAVRTASASLETARRDVERSSRLAGAGAIAERDLEQARNAQSLAQSQLADARARLTQAEEQAGKAVVRAPLSGVVSARPVNAGDVVAPGTALFTVVDPGSMRLEAAVPAAQLGQVRVGAPVRFTVSGYPGRTFTGRVERINPSADPATGQVPVYVSIPNSDGTLVSGLFAEGRVAAEEREALLVPAGAVVEEAGARMVVRLRRGRAERVPVRVGGSDSETEQVEIVAGLAAGDTVLVGAAAGTTPGTPVRVGRPAPAPAR